MSTDINLISNCFTGVQLITSSDEISYCNINERIDQPMGGHLDPLGQTLAALFCALLTDKMGNVWWLLNECLAKFYAHWIVCTVSNTLKPYKINLFTNIYSNAGVLYIAMLAFYISMIIGLTIENRTKKFRTSNFIIYSIIYINVMLLGVKNQFVLSQILLYKFHYIWFVMEINASFAGPTNHF